MKPRKPYQNRDPAFPSMYSMLYQLMRPTALELGYCLGLHGSMARDLDVVAVPWTEVAASAHELVEAIRVRLDAFIVVNHKGDTCPAQKPHGRLAWSLHLVGTGGYIDLSVMPRRTG